MSRTPLHLVLAIIGVAIIPLLGIAFAQVFLQVAIPTMTRDVAAIADIHPLTGFLSSLGILLWWTSASIWFFTTFIQWRDDRASNLAFLAFSGLLSAYLGMDDLFQFHEYLAPTYLGIPEKVVYGLLAVSVGAYLWRYRLILQRPDGVLLLLSLAFLSGSVLVDAALEPWLEHLKDWIYFLEDSLKWFGICFWTAFCVARSSSEISEPEVRS